MRLVLLQVLSLYQAHVSPWLGYRCRFYPSCSEYAAECVRREKSLLFALARATARLLRCQPWHPGGLDLP